MDEAKRSGVDITKQPDFDRAAFDKRCSEEGESRAREYVILETLARQENIKPDQDKMKKRIEAYSNYMKSAKPQAGDEEWRNGLDNISFSAFIDSVYSFLLSKVKINDKYVDAGDKVEKENLI
jgi:FKBP-type peptidyl-prolyl cis-trans isomerase (trigger factor)